MNEILYRTATLQDFLQIYEIFMEIIDEGETYSYTQEEMTPDRSLAYWISAPQTFCLVAEVDSIIAGVAAIRPNRTGRANHIANASFIVNKNYRRLGIANKLGKMAIDLAKDKGYFAMQFNFVVSSNNIAVNLWQSLGFKIIGTTPNGYQHKQYGLVDVHIMHKFL